VPRTIAYFERAATAVLKAVPVTDSGHILVKADADILLQGIMDAVAGARFMSRRGSPASLRLRDGTVTVLDDTYNANPVSMRAAIETLGLHAPRSGGSRIAVLADMLGMVGEAGLAAHADLIRPLQDAGVRHVLTMGEMMSHLHRSLPAELHGIRCASPKELCSALLEHLQPGDVVLFKGSGDTRISQTVDLLCAAVGSSLDRGEVESTLPTRNDSSFHS